MSNPDALANQEISRAIEAARRAHVDDDILAIGIVIVRHSKAVSFSTAALDGGFVALIGGTALLHAKALREGEATAISSG